jgi:hypothetical protein
MNFLSLTETNPNENVGWMKVLQQRDAEKCDQVNNNNNNNNNSEGV